MTEKNQLTEEEIQAKTARIFDKYLREEARMKRERKYAKWIARLKETKQNEAKS